jgi:hypothetical protein
MFYVVNVGVRRSIRIYLDNSKFAFGFSDRDSAT